MTAAGGSFGGLSFRFGVDMISSAISNGSVSGTSSAGIVVDFSNGSGAWDPVNTDFSVDFSGYYANYTMPTSGGPLGFGPDGSSQTAFMGTTLTGDLASLAPGTSVVNGELNVVSGYNVMETAALTGTVQNPIALVTGMTSGASRHFGNLPFSFEVNLDSGAIANGLVSGTASNALSSPDGATLVNLTGGQGAWNSGNGDFSVANFSGSYTLAAGASSTLGAPGLAITPQAGTSLTGNLASLSSGTAITGGALNVQGLAGSDLAPVSGAVQ
jgi:hypothetical protein